MEEFDQEYFSNGKKNQELNSLIEFELIKDTKKINYNDYVVSALAKIDFIRELLGPFKFEDKLFE